MIKGFMRMLRSCRPPFVGAATVASCSVGCSVTLSDAQWLEYVGVAKILERN